MVDRLLSLLHGNTIPSPMLGAIAQAAALSGASNIAAQFFETYVQGSGYLGGDYRECWIPSTLNTEGLQRPFTLDMLQFFRSSQ